MREDAWGGLRVPLLASPFLFSSLCCPLSRRPASPPPPASPGSRGGSRQQLNRTGGSNCSSGSLLEREHTPVQSWGWAPPAGTSQARRPQTAQPSAGGGGGAASRTAPSSRGTSASSSRSRSQPLRDPNAPTKLSPWGKQDVILVPRPTGPAVLAQHASPFRITTEQQVGFPAPPPGSRYAERMRRRMAEVLASVGERTMREQATALNARISAQRDHFFSLCEQKRRYKAAVGDPYTLRRLAEQRALDEAPWRSELTEAELGVVREDMASLDSFDEQHEAERQRWSPASHHAHGEPAGRAHSPAGGSSSARAVTIAADAEHGAGGAAEPAAAAVHESEFERDVHDGRLLHYDEVEEEEEGEGAGWDEDAGEEVADGQQ